jgi:lysophospholipase L1-like esterase
MQSRLFLRCLAAAGILLAGSPAQARTQKTPQEIRWTNVAEWSIEGRPFQNRKATYDRLPEDAEGSVRERVWELSRQSAGMAVRFKTPAKAIHVRYRLTSDRLALPHMPATGVSGVDLYAKDEEGTLRWVSVSRPAVRDVEQRLVNGMAPPADGGAREFLLYLPLYNGVERLEIGTPADHGIEPVPAPAGKPIVVYGTSIAHGACASRPGMAWPAILGRMLNREVINLGFSGNGRMETDVGDYLVRLDPDLFIVDCLPNMSPQQVRERTAPLVDMLCKARDSARVLLVEDRTFANAWLLPKLMATHKQRRTELHKAFTELSAKHGERIRILAGADLLGQDNDATTDGSHPNDLGMTRQAVMVREAVKPLLR